uniref:Ion transport domain-containing protein n=1 Tax=Electrophorus electricus TaxID=8005 RepID=A0AAY5E7Y2_ELEEL
KQRLSGDTSPSTEELKLALTWNRVDIARSELFTGDIQWKSDDLEDFMTDALVNNKPQFVHLFIENGLNILDYLTFGQLEELYRSISDSSLAYTLLVARLISYWLFSLLQRLTKVWKEGTAYRNHRCPHPWAALFIWAVLQNRREMFSICVFHSQTTESVLSALSGCKLLRELSKLERETETKYSMKELARKFENYAHDVFSQCYQSSESRSFVLLRKKSAIWGGATCLKMAMEADARYFFSHDGVQSLLSQIWWGDMNRSTEVWKLILTLFIPPLCYTNLISFRSIPQGKDIEWLYFWYAPVTAFVGNVLMYFLFLVLFAYVLLLDFKPPPPTGPSTPELGLYFWVFTIVCEEIREVGADGKNIFEKDVWHKCDLIAIILFLIVRLHITFMLGRAALCLDYMAFTIRLLHIFAIHKHLGPKIIIVGKMMKDVFFFLFFLGVWLMAYGVANQALMYTYDTSADRILRRVFYRPYLHIFGQIPVEEIDSGYVWNADCTDNTTLVDEGMEPCRNPHHNWLVVILLVVYLLVTNILLMNLLIAMFRYHTFSKVQERSDTHWKFQRFNVIVEYHSRPCLAPPFITSYTFLYNAFICNVSSISQQFTDIC